MICNSNSNIVAYLLFPSTLPSLSPVVSNSSANTQEAVDQCVCTILILVTVFVFVFLYMYGGV